MVRPAKSPTTGSVPTAQDIAENEPAPGEGGGSAVVAGTPGPVDPARAQAAEARMKADPIAQQHQLRINAKLTERVDPATAAQIVRVGHKISHAIYEEGSALAQRAAEALQGASALSGTGQVVTHGTITRSGNGFSYSPEPSDRLVVPTEDGRGTRTFTFGEIEGDLSSFEAFFGGDHDFSFRVQESTGNDLAVETVKRGQEHDVRVQGTIVYDGESYQADIRYHGEEARRSDTTGGEYSSTATYTGTVTGGGMELTVEERQVYQHVQAVRTEGLGGSATATTREINNRLEVGDDTYRWVGVRTRMSFRDGLASNVGSEWAASGELFLNDALLGTYQLGQRSGLVAFELDIGGQRVPIDQFDTR